MYDELFSPRRATVVYSLQVDLTYQIMKVEFKTTRKLS